MTEPLRLPVGIDDFEKIRKSDFYYGLFNGLYITGNQKLCEEYMGKYPVIFISLKLSRIIHSNCHIDYLEAEVLYLYFALPQVSSGLFY